MILDYKKQLMGVATVWVLLLHYYDQLYAAIHLPVITQISSIGYVGVEIFLFLSGAGLYYSLSRECNICLFYKKRILRTIAPWMLISFPYWILKTLIADGDSIKTFIMNLSGLSFWTRNIHTVWYCAFITVLYLLYPLVFFIQKHRCSIWPVIVVAVVFNFGLYAFFPAYYRSIEIALTRTSVFLLGSYYAETTKKNKSYTFVYWYGAVGFLFYLISFILPLESDVERLCRRYFAGGFVVIIMLVLVNWWTKKGSQHRVFGFFGEISLEVYLISVLFRNILTHFDIGTNNGIWIKWLIVVGACFFIICISKLFNAYYSKLINKMHRCVA